MRIELILAAFLGLVALRPAYGAELELYDEGTERVVDYTKYGTFENVGTEKYNYRIKDAENLKKAVGEGIFPNRESVLKDPAYDKIKKSRKFGGSHWNYVNNDDAALSFYKWATANEEPGAKLYYTALALEKSGLIGHAVKAYYALIVHFPKSTGRTYWETPWYMAPVAISKIKYLTANHPELGIELEDSSIIVKNSYDSDTKNDVFIVSPGRLVTRNDHAKAKKKREKSTKVVKTAGKGNVRLVRFSNGDWQLEVDGKPYFVRGMAYSPNKVGLSPDRGTLNASRDWMFADFNKNGVIDAPYEAWVDKNRNNRQNKGEENVGDFHLMKDMGVNTLRLYHHFDFNKKLLMEGYKNYGFMYLMGDFIGMYATASGADWFTGTDYTNPVQIKKMLESVKRMVEEYRNEPYILMWVLGNENNYGAPGVPGSEAGNGCRARLQPEAYYSFVNRAAKLVKSLDPKKRPVAICNGDILYLDICAENAPEIDIFGVNSYRGKEGFGSLWQDVKNVYDKPVVVTEYGCSAYHPSWPRKKYEAAQAEYIKGNWMDIENNFAGSGFGNALGGMLFEWTDEWWKANADLPERIQKQHREWYAKRCSQYKDLQPDKQDAVPQFGAPFLDGWSYEEWLGITSQGNGKHSPFMRQLRPACFELKKLWEKYR
ncbi:MAG: hypothetical protein JW803_03370 [Endomicrobiales bacterium]|nr:hypothetical protein [Endomicrobiales bacterium]